MNRNTKILITGGAGFIGYSTAKSLLKGHDCSIISVDNLNDYYDRNLKIARLKDLGGYSKFVFEEGDISNYEFVKDVFAKEKPDIVLNLAAQAGVRYSISHPESYIKSNIIGFFNILEAVRHSRETETPVSHLVYASSSSVYGNSNDVPYAESSNTDMPVSLYAATKKSNELMAYCYSKLYGFPATGLRFFTVYGPWGRPDMAYFSFTQKLIKGEKIKLFNNGDLYRDFTYIDDIVKGVIDVLFSTPKKDPNGVCHTVYNIGNNNPVPLKEFVDILQECLIKEGLISKKGDYDYLPMQPGDVYETFADVSKLYADFHFKPSTSLKDGLNAFAKWYKQYYGK